MYYQNQNDETLVMLTLAGEQRAYEVLVVRYQTAVISAALSITRNQFMAEDVAQDAFVTAWMKLNTLQEHTKFCSWVCKIAKNCAMNTVMRFRSFLPLEAVDNLKLSCNPMDNPAERYTMFEEDDDLRISIGKLPEKVKQIIHMHYFDGLSIVEIADKMRVSPGTVKWQLHDGRKRIRKELCAVNEKWNDTLVQRVMKKVEELKLWQVKNDKTGFEVIYKEVLREIEQLPESKDKNHALADVLMRGWWWLPGEKNDALFARIVSATEQGKNEEVMTFIVTREDSRVYGGAKIDFIREKQIPRLEKAGFVQALGREWFWLGYNYFREGNAEEGNKAYDKVLEILSPSDAYYVLIPYARMMEKLLADYYKTKSSTRYLIGGNAEEYRYINGNLCFWKDEGFGEGNMCSGDHQINAIFRNSSRCDGIFFADIGVGESYIGTDGTILTFASDNEKVETPAGVFEGCQLWVTTHAADEGKSTYKSYYKQGIGIVKHIHMLDGLTDVRLLASYKIIGGEGLLPMAAGNMWEYSAEYNPSVMTAELRFKICYSDSEKAIISYWENIERKAYDENSWVDMIEQIRNDYWNIKDGHQYICDVYHAINRAETLAKTPMEKAHTKAAASVARRILSTDPTFNPKHTATGHWNFFNKNIIQKKNDVILISSNYRWSFEWKRIGGIGDADTPLLYNDIYGILQDAANCIWSDEWRIGASPIIEYTKWDRYVRTKITCEKGGTISTKAGVFENCLKLSLDIGGMTDGLSYRGGKKVYYFADGIGIVRTENEYCGGSRVAVYELTSYEGEGEGYMPIADGMFRRYDALNLTDGYVGAVEYDYVADEDGEIVIFSDQIGIRELPPPITQYAAIQGEIIEDRLWEEGKHNDSRLRHDTNNFHLLAHFLGRPSRYWAAPEKAVVWNKYRLHIVENLSSEEDIPSAWYGFYTMTTFRTACALFGCGSIEEGYEYLEKAFSIADKWLKIPKGERLEVGAHLIYGGIKLVKDEGIIELPNGIKEPVSYPWMFECNGGEIYYGLTAPHGWEWFNSVRHEERYKDYIERAKSLMQI